MGIGFWVLVIATSGVAAWFWRRQVAAQREAFIRHFELPQGLFAQLRKKRPQLSQKDCQIVAQALRQFFLAYLKSGRRYVSMPSVVADELWHEFILFTRNYKAFCDKAFGGFLHHTPAVALGDTKLGNEGLRRAWWFACRDDNIDPRKPTRLPLLFALDAKLSIDGGHRYSIQRAAGLAPAAASAAGGDGGGGASITYTGDFGNRDIDGTLDGFGDGGSSGDGGGGDGGSCGGGGCGS